MSTNLIPFQFEAFPIRVVMIDSQPWWVAADVCAALEIANNRDALTRLDDDEKGVASTDTLGGKQEMAVINEPGLYSLILGSRKPEAKKFKRWVTHDVIPSIRKTGSYSVPNAPDFALPKTKAEALFLAAEQARIIEEQEAILTEQEPKVLLYDQLADSDGLIRFPNLLGMLKGKTGQDYKMADLKLFLRKAGMMCWQKELEPTVKAIDSGWFAVRYEDRTYDGVIHKVPEWAVTPKGFIAIWNVVAQPQRRYGQSSTQSALLTAANAAQQEGVRRIADESQRTYNATELGQQMTPPLSAIMVNRQLNIAGLIRKEFGDWLPTDAAEGLCELTDVSGRRHSNGTQVKQIKWFKRVLERLNPGGLKEAA
ncbi:BRO family protein [Candidatus Contendibacter odensensis]|uniref:Bro-N domain-containing protein n=1 Tax=Candidatus Contendobacter odensis Run_B_J11 TaxID=1400861 RepID=A0A7U7J278_9GAMM|nr:BRO family protein [Candidatus Contendobacter odensis]CDH43855.1 hypothetical protein BN874_1370020 [Candidatus Contendobacter odensis Run_B_J11]